MSVRSTGLSLSEAEIAELIAETVRAAPEPLPVGKIRAVLLPRCAVPEPILGETLEKLVADGHLHRFSPYRGEGARYWGGSIDAYAAKVIERELQGAPLSAAALEKKIASRLADNAPADRRRILDELVNSGIVTQLPQQPGERTLLFSAKVPDTAVALRPLVEDFAAKFAVQVARLEALGIDQSACYAALETLLDEMLFADAESGVATKPSVDVTATTAVPSAGNDLGTTILQEITVASKQQRHGGLISIRELRQAVGAQAPRKDAFDLAVLQLARDGKVWLYRHDYAASLSDGERQALVKDPQGNYYNGVSLRR